MGYPIDYIPKRNQMMKCLTERIHTSSRTAQTCRLPVVAQKCDLWPEYAFWRVFTGVV